MLSTSFIICLGMFLAIGLVSLTKSRGTPEDYLVTGKSTPAWLTGLSAIATNNSGFMFIGMIGLTYQTGLSAIWLMIGWIAGDVISSLLAAPGIRKASRLESVHSFGGLLAMQEGDTQVALRRLTGLLTVVFLTVYSAAQLKAGAKATSVMLGWPDVWGPVVGAVIILAYSSAGGLRASIWTDAAQSFVMIFGMAALVSAGVSSLGGLDAALEAMRNVQPGYMDWFPDGSAFSSFLFVTGWLFGGFTVLGQPHIMIRLVSMDQRASLNTMRVVYYSWYTIFYGSTIAAGLLARTLLDQAGGFDAETALPLMAQNLLPQWAAGLILAALFAATLSTADSLVLSCSAALTRDFSGATGHSLLLAKGATAFVVATATVIALWGGQSVFSLVMDAWGLLGSAFAPLMVVKMRGGRVSQGAGLAMMSSGVGVFLAWQWAGLGGVIYSAAPGVTTGLLVYATWRLFAGLKAR